MLRCLDTETKPRSYFRFHGPWNQSQFRWADRIPRGDLLFPDFGTTWVKNCIHLFQSSFRCPFGPQFQNLGEFRYYIPWQIRGTGIFIYLHGRLILMGFHVGKYASHMDMQSLQKNLLIFSKAKNPRQFQLPSSRPKSQKINKTPWTKTTSKRGAVGGEQRIVPGAPGVANRSLRFYL